MAESGPGGSAPEGAAYLCSAADMHQLTRRQPGARIEAKAIARPGLAVTIQIVALQ
jgi:hypothetical protein